MHRASKDENKTILENQITVSLEDEVVYCKLPSLSISMEMRMHYKYLLFRQEGVRG